MGRSRVVRPQEVTLYLVDVHRKALDELIAKGITTGGTTRKATAEEITRAESMVAQALSDGDWLRVKKRLTAGESREQFARIIKDAPGGERPTLASMQVGLSRILAYLLDWSLVDEKGVVLPIRNGKGELSIEVMTASLNSIDSESFGEILKAIEEHEEKMDAERVAEKNGKDGGSESSVTSPSPVSLAGATSGSPS